MYLLDTNVVSELRKGARAEPAVRRWNETVQETDCYLSSITLFELRLGALLKRRRDPSQGDVLLGWIKRVQEAFDRRTLEVTTEDWLRCAELHVPDPRPLRDSLIAAAAANRGFSVVTRNVRDMEMDGVEVINPWAS